MNQNELFRDNLRDAHWLGEVVDIADTIGSGRCRIKVFGKFDTLAIEDIPWAMPANASINGSYSVPNLGDIVAVYFDNGDIYTPLYKNQVKINEDLKSEVLDNSANPELVSSLIYDNIKGVRVYHSPENGLVISTGNGPEADPAIRLTNDGKIYLYANDIFIASSFDDESEPAVKGQTLADLLKEMIDLIETHQHFSGGPMLPNTGLKFMLLSNKINSIKQKL
jgi:hypothetical protein